MKTNGKGRHEIQKQHRIDRNGWMRKCAWLRMSECNACVSVFVWMCFYKTLASICIGSILYKSDKNQAKSKTENAKI